MKPSGLSVLSVVLLGCASVHPALTPPAQPLPFIADDYAQALAQARAQGLPLFVDAWADWCHTCQFMRSTVLREPSLAKHAGRFVWLEVNTERASASAFLQKHPVEAWPSFLVIEPSTETVAFRWLGSATVEQLERLLDDAERALSSGVGEGAQASLVRADRANAAGRHGEAALAYREALFLSAPDWDKRSRAAESLLFSLSSADRYEECASAAAELAPTLTRGPSFANAVAIGLSCALDAPSSDKRTAAVAALEPLAKEALTLPGLLDDDRSGVFGLLVDLRKNVADEPGAIAWAIKWLSFLEEAAERADDPVARAAFDSHRVSAAISANTPGRALAPLLASQRALPEDYNAPARLAIIYRELGRQDEALAAAERALAKVSGPRRIRVLETKASIQKAKGSAAQAKQTLEEAILFARGLPEGQRSEKAIGRLQAQLVKLGL